MDQDYIQFITDIRNKTGIDLSLYKEAQMKRRLTSLYQKRGFHSFREFFQALNKDIVLLEEFLDRMTINVTEFFRNKPRWDILEQTILPRLLSKTNQINIWSAACSTGEEPYTLAMILSKYVPLNKVSILATDIDERALNFAQAGMYHERNMVNIPSDLAKKFFVQENNTYKVKNELKNIITFKKMNLLADPFPTNLHLIVCRNVLIYFTEEAKNELYKKFSVALSPGGVLFVGSTEQIFNPSQYALEVEETFFYRKQS